MAIRQKRLQAILDIVNTHEIETQEELTRALVKEGYPVTQATVSRDIRTLHLGKIRGASGHQRYAVVGSADEEAMASFLRVMQEAVVSMDQAQNILVIKTVSGMAMAVAAALDALDYPEIVGCIAGDDTVFAAVKSAEETKALIGKIKARL